MKLAPTCSALFLLLACGAPDAAKAPVKAEPAKAPAKAGDPHGTSPHGTSPHGTSPHGTSPHGPITAPVPAPPVAKAPVNPKDVTPSGKVRAEEIAGLSLSVPEEWVRRPPSNQMRLSEFTLPGPGGEVTLVVSRFAGGGGDAASNVARWKSQFTRSDGSPVGDEHAKVTVVDKAPLKITTVDLQGTNIAPVTPGAAEQFNEPDSRMLAAIVEGVGDPYFLKATGAAPTLAVWEAGFRAMVDTLAVTPAAPAK